MSYSLNAVADQLSARGASDLSPSLHDAAAQARDAIRRLMTLLVEIHPPNLRSTGLQAAVADLLAPLRARGLETELSCPAGLSLRPEVEQLAFRAIAEALRNVQRHSHAKHVAVAITEADGAIRATVSDDGVGFGSAERDRRRTEGHFGLTLLQELVERHDGRLTITSTPGSGTSVVLEVPNR